MTTFSDITGFIGMICSICVAFGLIFQIRRMIKRKSSKDVSLTLFLIVIVSYTFWTLHGISIKNLYLGIAQGVGLTLSSITLYFILKYRK